MQLIVVWNPSCNSQIIILNQRLKVTGHIFKVHSLHSSTFYSMALLHQHLDLWSNTYIWKIVLLWMVILILKTAAENSPWDTPLDELKIVQQNKSVCNNKSIDLYIEPIELEWQNCIISFLPISVKTFQSDDDKFRTNYEDPVGLDENSSDIDEAEQERQFYATFCGDPSAYKKCWSGIVGKLNECTPGRGNTSALIYFTMYDHSCKNNGTVMIENRIKTSETEDLCDHNYGTQICKDSNKEWGSVDLCRRFVAQRNCDISSLSHCTNIKYKEINEENLNQIQQSLGCFQTQDALNSSSSSSNPFCSAKFVFTSWNLLLLLLEIIN